MKVRDLRIVARRRFQRPHTPIWVAGIAPKAVDRAARLGFNFRAAAYADAADAYAAALREHGRDPKDFQIAGMRALFVAEDRRRAWEIAARSVRHTADCYVQWYVEESADSAGVYAEMMAGMPSLEEMIEKKEFNFFGEESLIGTPQDVIPAIEEYVEHVASPISSAQFRWRGVSTADIRTSMRLFAREVIPHFR